MMYSREEGKTLQVKCQHFVIEVLKIVCTPKNKHTYRLLKNK